MASTEDLIVTCASCRRPIIAGSAFIKALGQNYHVDHFTCTKCGQILGSGSFHEHQGMPYCRKDFFEQFVSRCKLCDEYIEGPMIIALEANWHFHHFVCTYCSASIAAGEFHVLIPSKEPCCSSCFTQNILSPICYVCRSDIRPEDMLEITAKKLHRACLKCETCGCHLTKEEYRDFEGKIFCNDHYYAARAAPCDKCKDPIIGARVLYKQKEYHVECFACKSCKRRLSKETNKEILDTEPCAVLEKDIYCNECLRALTSASSAASLTSSQASSKNPVIEKHEELFNILKSAEDVIPPTSAPSEISSIGANTSISVGKSDRPDPLESSSNISLVYPQGGDEPSNLGRSDSRNNGTRVSLMSNQRNTWHPNMTGVEEGLAELDRALDALSFYTRADSYSSLASLPTVPSTTALAQPSPPNVPPPAAQPAVIYSEPSKKELSMPPVFAAPKKVVVEDVATVLANQHLQNPEHSPNNSRSRLGYHHEANSGFISANVSRTPSASSQTSQNGALPRARDAIMRAPAGRPVSMLVGGSAPVSSRPSFSGPSISKGQGNSASTLKSSGSKDQLPSSSTTPTATTPTVKEPGENKSQESVTTSRPAVNMDPFALAVGDDDTDRRNSTGDSHYYSDYSPSTALPPLSSSWFARVEGGLTSGGSSPNSYRRSTFAATSTGSSPPSPKVSRPVPKAELEVAYSELVKRPKGVNLVALESHLSDVEFERELGVNRHDFYGLPAWKQKKIKETARLF